MIALSRLLLVFLLALSPAAVALEVSLTVEGEPEEIQAVLDFIKTLKGGAEGEADPLKINVHSIADTAEAEGEAEPETGAAGATPAPVVDIPLALERAEVNPTRGAPGSSFLISVNVRDKYDEVDTLSARLGETSLSTDLYDDGTHGDATPGDGVWSATLTPLDVTPTGVYAVAITAYDKNGKSLNTLDEKGTVIPLATTVELTVER